MSDSNSPQYLQLAKKFNLDIDKLKSGGSIRQQVSIGSLAEFKELLTADISEDTRKQTQASFLQAHPDAFKGGNNEAHLLTLLSSHVYGQHTLTAEDEKAAEAMFPIEVSVAADKKRVIDTPETYGPGSTAQIIICDTLMFSKAGSITMKNTVLRIVTDELIVNTDAKDIPYQIGVMGAKGQAGKLGDDGKAYTTAAYNGSSVGTTSPGICPSTSGGSGSAGAKGHNGSGGDAGKAGKPSLQANITINKTLSGLLVVTTQSGAGGDGGAGGKGADGQNAGDGGKGCNDGCQGSAGGDAGSGGDGGNGGHGGNGGPAVNGNNVSIIVPKGKISDVIKFAENASPGEAGNGGGGGNGGSAGTKGSGGKGKADGDGGSKGEPGDSGDGGSEGTVTGSPGTIFVSE